MCDAVPVFSRRKLAVSRERLKLLFKQHCEPHNGTITLKVSQHDTVHTSGSGPLTPAPQLAVSWSRNGARVTARPDPQQGCC